MVNVRSLTTLTGILQQLTTIAKHCKTLIVLTLSSKYIHSSTLMDTLRACVSLKSLEIISFKQNVSDFMKGLYSREKTVFLPTLERLSFSHLSSFPDIYLTKLHLPNLRILTLGPITSTF